MFDRDFTKNVLRALQEEMEAVDSLEKQVIQTTVELTDAQIKIQYAEHDLKAIGKDRDYYYDQTTKLMKELTTAKKAQQLPVSATVLMVKGDRKTFQAALEEWGSGRKIAGIKIIRKGLNDLMGEQKYRVDLKLAKQTYEVLAEEWDNAERHLNEGTEDFGYYQYDDVPF